MVKQEPFLLEQFSNKYEDAVDTSLADTCCCAVSVGELEKLAKTPLDPNSVMEKHLTYGWITGSDHLKSEISKLYEHIDPVENVVITTGGIGANFLSFYSLIEPGDHAIVTDPCYQQLGSLPKVFGAEVDVWRLREENGWQMDLKELESLVRPNTKVIILNSPNNPTGALISCQDLDKIIEIARKGDIYILCDEVYRPLFHSLSQEEIPLSIADLYEKGISTGSMSKAFSMPGLRLGWIASKAQSFIEDCLLKRAYNTISVTPISDIIATFALAHKDEILKRNYDLCIENLKIVKAVVAKSNGKLSLVAPRAGTTCFLKIVGVPDTNQLCLDLVRDYKTLFLPGEVFGYPGYVRLGFGNSTIDVTLGMENLLKRLSE